MNQLELYILLHGNLNFSSIPKELYSKVLDNSYWPMLDLIEQGHKIALEFPAHSLMQLEKIDCMFTQHLSKLINEKKCEFIASCFIQSILPLCPEEINDQNILQARKIYEDILGVTPSIFFLPEQTFSQGAAYQVAKQGYQTIIADWDNASEFNSFSRNTRYSINQIKTPKGSLNVLWNSSMNSFKFQRFIYGRISLKSYIDGIIHHYKKNESRILCIYGTDWEIFNFRPLTGEIAKGEIERVKVICETIDSLENIKLCLPSQIINQSKKPNKSIQISTATLPLPCKNRDDYNVVRWTVSGRDSVYKNTFAFKVFSEYLSWHYNTKKNLTDQEWQLFLELWASDQRTKITDCKHYEFGNKIHTLRKMFKTELPITQTDQSKIPKIKIFNSTPFNWDQEILSKTIKFKPGILFNKLKLKKGTSISCQCENIEYYRDGSIRLLNLIFEISLKQKQTAIIELEEDKNYLAPDAMIKINGSLIQVSTDRVNLVSNMAHGGDIQELQFPQFGSTPWIKYLPPVYFDNIAYSNDYYSGWNQLCLNDGNIIFDTAPSNFNPSPDFGDIRTTIHFKQGFYDGFLLKTYHIYHQQARLDCIHHFYFPATYPYFLRCAITTLNPEAFDIQSLKYETTHGSNLKESYSLLGQKINHIHSPNPRCSALTCLGSSSGWLNFKDNNHQLSQITNKSALYSIPLLEYKEIESTFLLRTYHSICESDETGQSLMRGHNKLSVTYLGLDATSNRYLASSYLKNHPPKITFN